MENKKMLVYRVKMDDFGFLYTEHLEDIWETIENSFLGVNKEHLIDTPYSFKIDVIWMEKAEYDALEPFEP